MSDGSGILPRRDNASSEPDVLLLKRPSVEVWRKNLVDPPPLSLLNCENGVGMADDDADEMISVLPESGPPLLIIGIHKCKVSDLFSDSPSGHKTTNSVKYCSEINVQNNCNH